MQLVLYHCTTTELARLAFPLGMDVHLACQELEFSGYANDVPS